MHLDMLTMSVASVAVTAVLGLVLMFTWRASGKARSSAGGGFRSC